MRYVLNDKCQLKEQDVVKEIHGNVFSILYTILPQFLINSG